MVVRRIHGEEPSEDQVQVDMVNRERSFRSLFVDLADEFSTLIRQEVALVRAETSEKVSQAGAGVTWATAGAVFAMAGLIVLLLAAVFGLSELMHPAWAALIVGAVAVLIGFLAVQRGRHDLKARNLLPQRSAESLRRDAEVATRRFK